MPETPGRPVIELPPQYDPTVVEAPGYQRWLDADAFTAKFGIPVLTSYAATEFGGGVAGWTLSDLVGLFDSHDYALHDANDSGFGEAIDVDAVLDSVRSGPPYVDLVAVPSEKQ